jgi:hypothetical protein
MAPAATLESYTSPYPPSSNHARYQDAPPLSSKLPRTVIKTHTITIYVTADEDASTPLSPQTPADLAVERPTNGVDIYGVIPGLRSPSPRAAPPTFSTIAASTGNTLPHTRTKTSNSKYPRPSPPGFLYPLDIVPRHATAMSSPSQGFPQTQQSSPGLGRSAAPSNVIWYLPYGLEVLIFTIVVLGLVWTVLIWGVNYAAEVSDANSKEREKGKGNSREEGGKKKTKPVDKPSKYAPAARRRSSTCENERVAQNPSATTSARKIYKHENLVGEVELTQRPRHRRQVSHPVASSNFTIGSDVSTPRKPSPTPPRKTPTSPSNPFPSPPFTSPTHLAPPSVPLKPRSSAEWLAERELYFSHTTPTPRNPSHRSISPNSTFDLDTAQLEALEAGVTPIVPRTSNLRTPRSSGSEKERKRGSWVDLGLGGLRMVDDAVGVFVGKVVRWTDDDDDWEGEMLLPVSRGRGVEVE